MNYLPGLALSHEPTDLCLLSSWDYRHEPLVPDCCHFCFLFFKWQSIEGKGALCNLRVKDFQSKKPDGTSFLNLHFTDKGIESQEGQVTCSKLASWKMKLLKDLFSLIPAVSATLQKVHQGLPENFITNHLKEGRRGKSMFVL
jgi:hypothetical protein